MSSNKIPQHTAFALENFSKSGSSGLYNTARPNYPKESLIEILSNLKNNKNKIVELGAGTGLFTRMLLEESSLNSGKIDSILAIEPSSGMRSGFENALKEMSKKDGGSTECKIIDGSFDQIDCKDGEVDMVIAAQAFHWIGKEAVSGSSAINEISRVLKPGGKFVLIWNLEDRRTEWVRKLRDAYEGFEEGTPQYRHGYWKSIFSLPQYSTLFTSAVETQYYRTLNANSELVVNRVLSKSFITAQTKEVQDIIVEKVKQVVEEGDGKVYIDKEVGTFEYPYTTDLFIMTRK